MAQVSLLEKNRAMKLAQSRKNPSASKEEESAGSTTTQILAFGVSAVVVLLIAAGADFLDWLGIGSIPILFDILDIAVWLIIAGWVWLMNLERPPLVLFSGFIELIPFVGDFIPTWIIMMLVIIFYNTAGKRVLKMVSPI